MTRYRGYLLGIYCLAVLAFVGCTTTDETAEENGPAVVLPETSATGTTMPQSAADQLIRAVVDLQPTEGNDVRGTVTFTQEAEGVRIMGDIYGLTPGKHGIHIHENGDCSAPDASSAGEHYNPTSMIHGAPTDMVRHIGDMGNLDADTSGTAHIEYLDRLMKLEGPTSVIGKALIVHAAEDDLTTQPTGNSGARVACGVITADQ